MKVEWNRVTWYSKIVAIIVVIGIFFVGMYVGIQYESAISLTSNAAYAIPSSNPVAVQGTPSSTAPTTCATITASNGPSLGLGPFINAFPDGILTDSDKATIECYFNDPSYYTAGNPLYSINLNKNFTNFIVALNSYTLSEGIVTISVTDPENNYDTVTLYIRTHNNQVQIIGLNDPDNALK